jgi:hypothetical protein
VAATLECGGSVDNGFLIQSESKRKRPPEGEATWKDFFGKSAEVGGAVFPIPDELGIHIFIRTRPEVSPCDVRGYA